MIIMHKTPSLCSKGGSNANGEVGFARGVDPVASDTGLSSLWSGSFFSGVTGRLGFADSLKNVFEGWFTTAMRKAGIIKYAVEKGIV
jgi:hypothetical protein